MVTTSSLHLLTGVRDTGGYSVCYQSEKVNTNPVTKPEIYNGDLPTRYAGAVVATTLWK